MAESQSPEARKEFGNKLREILGSPNVYFQPPESIKMKYPCIVYHNHGEHKRNANDKMYLFTRAYDVTVIDPNPDSEIPSRLREAFPYCRYQRHFTIDNLNHETFVIYF